VKVGCDDRPLTTTNYCPIDRHRDERSAHHEGKGRIPGATDIEEGSDAGRINHSRNCETGAKQHAATKRDNHLPDHRPAPKARRIVTVAMPDAMN
ncbi:hypothetical protein LTR94_032925, partial [Friedmanniomyces endolithicus]